MNKEIATRVAQLTGLTLPCADAGTSASVEVIQVDIPKDYVRLRCDGPTSAMPQDVCRTPTPESTHGCILRALRKSPPRKFKKLPMDSS